jgi:imidazolonepropionase-like amidohydrolase
VIDGTGLTVYPGLIDSYTNLALPEAAPSPSPAVAVAAASFCCTQQQRAAVVQTRLSPPDCNRK